METQEGNKDYTTIKVVAAKFGFIQSKNSNAPHLFTRKEAYNTYLVDLSASGDSEYAVAKNIIDQMIDRSDDEVSDAKFNAEMRD